MDLAYVVCPRQFMKQTKIYRPHALVQGFKVNLPDAVYVAIPDRDYKECLIKVIYDNQYMLIKNWHKALIYRRFHDQYGRQDSYTLGYFKWEPQGNALLNVRYVGNTAIIE